MTTLHPLLLNTSTSLMSVNTGSIIDGETSVFLCESETFGLFKLRD